MFLLLFWLYSLVQTVQAEVIWNLPDITSRQWPILHKGIEGKVTIPFDGSIGRGVLPLFVEFKSEPWLSYISNALTQLWIASPRVLLEGH